MQANEHARLARQLADLRQQHRDLDTAIAHLAEARAGNELRLTRLKKQKLALKDSIATLESRLIPDLDA